MANELNEIALQLAALNAQYASDKKWQEKRYAGLKDWMKIIDEKISNGLSETVTRHDVEIEALKTGRANTGKLGREILLKGVGLFFAVLLAILTGRLIPS